MSEVKFQVTLTDRQAAAYAQHLKSMGFNDYLGHAYKESEAYSARDAGEQIRIKLAEKEYYYR